MTNLDRMIAVLAKHREARNWTDEAVARDALAQFGLNEAGEAHSAPLADAAPLAVPAVLAADAVADPGATAEVV